MATNLAVNSEFNGALAGDLFVQAFKKSDSIEKNIVTVLPNNIGTGYLPRLSYNADLQDYACGFTPTGDVTYKDVTVNLKKFKIDHELCKDEFHQTFQAQQAGLFSADNEIPQDIQSGIILAIVENLGAKVDDFIWNGRGVTQGLKDKILADAGTIGVWTSALTKANIVDAFETVYDAIPDEIINDPNLVLAVSSKAERLYRQNLASQSDNSTVSKREIDYLGVRIESSSAIPGDNIFAYRVRNVGFLTGIEADLNEVRVIDHDATSGDGTLRTKSVLELGVGFSFAEEIVAHDISYL